LLQGVPAEIEGAGQTENIMKEGLFLKDLAHFTPAWAMQVFIVSRGFPKDFSA
jgi:hypothetical protein